MEEPVSNINMKLNDNFIDF